MELKRILLATDFSAGSDVAVPYALDLARRYGATIYLMHVIYDIERELSWYPTQVRLDDYYKDMEASANEEFRRLVEGRLENYGKVECVLLRGIPDQEILKYAEENAMDLIVMGTHGRKGLDRVFFGSTASTVIKQAGCPVLSVRIPHAEASRR